VKKPLAEDWIRRAEKVVEPPKDDIVKGARTDLVLCKFVEREQAAAITINWLGVDDLHDVPGLEWTPTVRA